jgi:hypothetical protein
VEKNVGPHPEDHGIFGFRSIAEVAESNNLQWFPNIQVSTWWNWHYWNDTWHMINRKPTSNEIFCEAYLAFTYGAKGISYFTIAPGYRVYGGSTKTIVPNPDAYGCTLCSGVFNLCVERQDQQEDPVVHLSDFPDCIHNGYLQPNDRYYAIKDLNRELDDIESVLLALDWDTSFCTNFRGTVQTNYDYLDSLWTTRENEVPDDCVLPIDSTFVQVGVFNGSAGVYDINKYLMLVNRRCLASESRAVNYRLDFESEYRNQCFCVIDYVLDPNLVRLVTTDDDGILIDSIISLPPGHGRLLNIHNLYPSKMTIDTNAVVDWLPDTLIFVSDTVDVYGTLTFILVLM